MRKCLQDNNIIAGLTIQPVCERAERTCCSFPKIEQVLLGPSLSMVGAESDGWGSNPYHRLPLPRGSNSGCLCQSTGGDGEGQVTPKLRGEEGEREEERREEGRKREGGEEEKKDREEEGGTGLYLYRNPLLLYARGRHCGMPGVPSLTVGRDRTQ
eukprot:766750-Hanusia_phi.AAC.3